jgi:hypothetical protein
VHTPGSRRGEHRKGGVIGSEYGESRLEGHDDDYRKYILAASVYTTPWKADENKGSPFPGSHFVRGVQ